MWYFIDNTLHHVVLTKPEKCTCWRRPESESKTQASIRMFCFKIHTKVMFLLHIQVTNRTDWMSLPASGQQRWHSWSSCTGEHSLQQLLPPIQQIKVAVFRNKGEKIPKRLWQTAIRLTNILDFNSCPTTKERATLMRVQ